MCQFVSFMWDGHCWRQSGSMSTGFVRADFMVKSWNLGGNSLVRWLIVGKVFFCVDEGWTLGRLRCSRWFVGNVKK
jgi:hypothetical protein